MGNIHITIDSILLNCDESVAGISLGNGYTIYKQNLDDFVYKDRIVDGRGKLNINYIGSRICENGKIYFMCLHKEDNYQINIPKLQQGKKTSDKEIYEEYEKQLDVIKTMECEYLTKCISLLRLFKEGNLNYKNIFITFEYGIIFNTHRDFSIENSNNNPGDTRVYSLSPNEITQCNTFIQSYSGKEYLLLKDCIDIYTLGLYTIDQATAFEKFNTVLEMTLLKKDQKGKKKVLAKRVAILLGKDPTDIKSKYNLLCNFYSYRSESSHEGKDINVTKSNLLEMENITKKVICYYLNYCKKFLLQNPQATWETIKLSKISILKKDVANAISAGILSP